MQHIDWLEKARRLVAQTFASQGAEADEGFCETLLVRDGFYCGRCFSLSTMRAVWFAEENVVKFYGRNGEFLMARPVGEEECEATIGATAEAA